MPSRTAIAVVLLAAAVALLGGRVSLPDGDGSSTSVAPSQEGRVVRVVDGDTIHVRLGGREETVRYIGIDTPESVKPNTPVQCFAKEASRYNARLVEGRTVRVVLDREARDRYGRLLAYVHRRADGLFVNDRLVRDGYARTLSIAPNTRFANRFSASQNAARAAGRGLWGRC